MTSIAIIVGSTRPSRFGIQPAEWILNYAKKHYGDKADFELVDLKAINLPLYDEPVSPSLAELTTEHGLNWQKIVAKYDGYIFEVAEYNHSMTAALKNAIDYAWHEWNYKPVSFVSHGSAAGGARAVEHLRQIAAEVKLYDLRDQVLLPHYYTNLDDNGQFIFGPEHDKQADALLTGLTYWAEKMQPLRAELLKK